MFAAHYNASIAQELCIPTEPFPSCQHTVLIITIIFLPFSEVCSTSLAFPHRAMANAVSGATASFHGTFSKTSFLLCEFNQTGIHVLLATHIHNYRIKSKFHFKMIQEQPNWHIGVLLVSIKLCADVFSPAHWIVNKIMNKNLTLWSLTFTNTRRYSLVTI